MFNSFNLNMVKWRFLKMQLLDTTQCTYEGHWTFLKMKPHIVLMVHYKISFILFALKCIVRKNHGNRFFLNVDLY